MNQPNGWAKNNFQSARERMAQLSREAKAAHEAGRLEQRNKACSEHDEIALRLLQHAGQP